MSVITLRDISNEMEPTKESVQLIKELLKLPERTRVQSSNISSIGFKSKSPEEGVLEVEFLNGSVYQYDNIPFYVYEELMSAGSHGRYFIKNIRNSYNSKKIK